MKIIYSDSEGRTSTIFSKRSACPMKFGKVKVKNKVVYFLTVSRREEEEGISSSCPLSNILKREDNFSFYEAISTPFYGRTPLSYMVNRNGFHWVHVVNSS